MQVQCFAQTKITVGEMKGKYEIFTIFKLDNSLYSSIPRIGIYSKSNKYSNGIPYSKAEKDPHFLPMNPKKDIHVDDDAIKSIVYAVLNKKLAALKVNKENMNIIIVFELNGKLSDIGFTLNANTLITLEEIESIDLQLREKIKATFTGKEYLQYTAINYYPHTIVF